MAGSFGQTGQVIARIKAQADAGFAAEVDDALEAGIMTLVVPLAGNANVIELAASGDQRLFYRMQAIENFHLI